ncbi:MAG: hypothetical protein B6242_01290 [Anaerolineaceae bacterium 4572_78]|nr:MAG: hypothetical protein B6242_01290 [Anaerolineaceae bacterium 4572_78]
MNILHRIGNRLTRKPKFNYLIIVARELDATLPMHEAKIPFSFETLPSDASEIEQRLTHIPPHHRNDIHDRVARGDRCTIAVYKGQIIFVGWMGMEVCYSYWLDRYYKLAPHESYSYSAYTIPEFRGQGVHPTATYKRLQLLNEWGCTIAYAFIDPHNKAALRMPKKLGYTTIGKTGFIEVFGIRFYFHNDKGVFEALDKHHYFRRA